ncbi:MAG: FecR domain-containing protein [Rhodocyclaceae bacterium]|nr:FecR domain-containing protein [Rhodocyclaceae bacterium]MBK9624637.1 FecR domain-containing protein [Rhodocyclaceae bacterium]MBL0077000.1 FecR domain-containing protein [Rhodocyclaceae bacterium]MBP6110284.1 FecR domain-containing protein [Rhodocyclaceae bacterium]
MKALSGFLILGCLLVAGSATAGVGTVTHLSGILSAKGSAGASKVLSVKSEVNEGDLLTTETETYARVKFVDGAEIVLRPGTQLRVAAYSFQEAKPQNDSAFFSLIKGGLRAVTGLLGKRSQDKVGFTTNTATIGIRGTHFGALLCSGDCTNVPTASGNAPPDGLHVDVSSGAVVVTNAAGNAVIGAGQFGFVPNANTIPAVVPPSQGIQVTMPPNIAQNKGGGGGVGKGDGSECKL